MSNTQILDVLIVGACRVSSSAKVPAYACRLETSVISWEGHERRRSNQHPVGLDWPHQQPCMRDLAVILEFRRRSDDLIDFMKAVLVCQQDVENS
jgi:hypothetical protein